MRHADNDAMYVKVVTGDLEKTTDGRTTSCYQCNGSGSRLGSNSVIIYR